MAVVKKVLKDKKKKKNKLSLKKVVNNMPSVFVIYEAVYIDEYSTSFTIISFKKYISSLHFFELYISTQYFKLITWYKNINVKFKYEKASNGNLESDFKDEMSFYPCLWKKTTGVEMVVFLGILFMESTCKLPKAKNYWNMHKNELIILPIQITISPVYWK